MLYDPLARGDNRGISSVYYAVRSFFYRVAIAFTVYSIAVGLIYHKLAHVEIFREHIFYSLFS